MDFKKFDVVIGNPPYQDEPEGDTPRMPPVYHHFMEAAYEVAEKVVLITPARFLSDQGQTPKAWREKMLADSHLAVKWFVHDAQSVFPGAEIKGGVAVTFRDSSAIIGPIGVFTAYEQLASILGKVQALGRDSLASIATSRAAYKWAPKAFEDHARVMSRLPAGSRAYVGANAFTLLPELFDLKEPSDSAAHARLLGLSDSHRAYRWIRSDYLGKPVSFDAFKVIFSKASGTGAFGESLSSPLVGEPGLGYTDTFLSIGSFGSSSEASACLNYLKSKFARTLLSISKTTHNMTASTWKYVPLQDFAESSDIKWSQSIREIDQALYRNMGLTNARSNSSSRRSRRWTDFLAMAGLKDEVLCIRLGCCFHSFGPRPIVGSTDSSA